MGAQEHKLPFKISSPSACVFSAVVKSTIVDLPIRCNLGYLQSTQTYKFQLTVALRH